jgi:phthalate 4,5-dioxygenase oxygenase subunit
MATLSRAQQQDLICRVTGDAPAGQMFRRYWFPVLLAEEVAEPDGTPVRVRLLGTDLVAFRDTAGALGMLAAACPHRLASLALGRNEERGLRCIYHGWKFAADGRCMEMPTEPPDSTFAQRLRAAAFPVREAGGLIWTYIGPPELEPPFPAYEFTRQPREQIATAKYLQRSNYLQMAEGAIDSAHTRFLHRGSNESNEAAHREAVSRDLAPRLEAADTCYGFRYAAIRRPNVNPETTRYVKETRYVFPAGAVTSAPLERENAALTQFFVPVDDERTMHFSIWHSLVGKPVDQDRYRKKNLMVPGVDLDAAWTPLRNLDNWYQQDRAAMRDGSWTGIPSLMLQDAAVQETMGAITDHTQERLGTSDVAIIRLRRRMFESVERFMEGRAPVGLGTAFDYGRLTHIEQKVIGIDEPWENVSTFPGEYDLD